MFFLINDKEAGRWLRSQFRSWVLTWYGCCEIIIFYRQGSSIFTFHPSFISNFKRFFLGPYGGLAPRHRYLSNAIAAIA